MLAGDIQGAVEAALLRASAEASAIFVPPENSRAYLCSAEACVRPAYAKGLCNAHYGRARNGKPAGTPIRARKRQGCCAECGIPARSKGGWGLCSKHYRFKRYAVIKDALIALFGGRCARCGGAFPRAAFDFHHSGSKDASPSYLVGNASAETIGIELERCELLCANCHRIEHASDLI